MLRWKPIVVVTLISQALAVGRQFRTVLDAIMFKWKMEMVSQRSLRYLNLLIAELFFARQSTH